MAYPNFRRSGDGDPTRVTPENRQAYRAWTRALIVLFVLAAGVIGVRFAFAGTSIWARAGWSLVALPAVAMILSGARRAVRHIIGIRRLRKGLCVHCGYKIAVTRGIVCPECGGDPFE